MLTMDGDLQHDPDEIPSFLARLEEGYDVSVGGGVTARTISFCGVFRPAARTG